MKEDPQLKSTSSGRVISGIRQSVVARKARLDALRPLPSEALARLEHYYDVEITYTSNAIEGNTLSPVETTLVIEKGVTIAGKPLKDHLEALDHYDAMRYLRELAASNSVFTESDIRNVHRLVMQRSQPEIAGSYANLRRYVRTESGRHEFPLPAEVPALMGDFVAWLRTVPTTPEEVFAAHRRLVEIHPFNDGNGRTARLVMNLVLIRGGYPPLAVRPEDCVAYIRALRNHRRAKAAWISKCCCSSGWMRLWESISAYLVRAPGRGSSRGERRAPGLAGASRRASKTRRWPLGE